MTPKKKILVFVDWFKPGYKAGGPIQSVYNLVSRLSAEFDFYVYTSNTDLSEREPYHNVKFDEWTKFEGINVFYASKKNQVFLKAKSIIKKLNPEVVYVNSLFSLHYALVPMFLHKIGLIKKIVIAPRGMLGSGALGIKSAKKQLFLKAFKQLGLFNNVVWQATSVQEVEDVKSKININSNMLYSPNLPNMVSDIIVNSSKKEKELNLVSVARISPEKGLIGLLKILKIINFNLKLDLFGPINDTKYWTQCKQIIKSLPPNITVSYNGSIESYKISELYQKYDFMISTTLGENFGHAIFQSFSSGLPVIISDKTPWKSLQGRNIGWDVNIDIEGELEKILIQASLLSLSNHLLMKKASLKFAKEFSNNEELLNSAKNIFN